MCVSTTDWIALASLILSGTVRWTVPQLTQTKQASSGWSSSQRFFTSARSATALSVDLLLARRRTPLYISSYHHQLPRLNTDTSFFSSAWNCFRPISYAPRCFCESTRFATARELSIVTSLRQMLQNADAFGGPASEGDRRRQVPFSVVPLHGWLAVSRHW